MKTNAFLRRGYCLLRRFQLKFLSVSVLHAHYRFLVIISYCRPVARGLSSACLHSSSDASQLSSSVEDELRIQPKLFDVSQSCAFHRTSPLCLLATEPADERRFCARTKQRPSLRQTDYPWVSPRSAPSNSLVRPDSSALSHREDIMNLLRSIAIAIVLLPASTGIGG
jgi:hypothetical protein